MGNMVIHPAMMDQKRNLFLQTSYIHCVKYFLDFGCMRKNDLRMFTISQAKNSANHVKHTNVVARARKTNSQSVISSDHSLLQPRARLPSPNPHIRTENAARQSAAVQTPYTKMSITTSQVKMPCLL